MTGFGESERDLSGTRLSVQVRSVNHRFLNVQFRTPPGMERHQAALERALRDRFVRGHVNVSIGLERPGSSGVAVAVDVERARGYVQALRGLQEELGLEGRIEVGLLPWFRDVFREAEGIDAVEEVAEAELVAALSEAAARAAEMREAEGARLAEDLEARLDAMEGVVVRIAERAPTRLVTERDRLRGAIQELLGADLQVDEERIAREVAHLAERWDIHEEIVRFRAHLAMFRDTIRTGDPAGIGKRLGFIAQEILREANTMGSKANDAEIAERVVVLKEEIERLREQLENVE
ncbi:MAG: YicC/YloC family endoribonuclease [Gemmatimonadota bacterium]